MNVFKTYRFVTHSIDITETRHIPLDGVCYYSNHFEDLVKLLENILVKRSKKWSYHRTEGQENLNHIAKCSSEEFTQTVSLENFQSLILILFSN